MIIENTEMPKVIITVDTLLIIPFQSWTPENPITPNMKVIKDTVITIVNGWKPTELVTKCTSSLDVVAVKNSIIHINEPINDQMLIFVFINISLSCG